MPEEKPPPFVLPAELASLEVTRSADYKAVYSNVYRSRLGAEEITLIFGRLRHAPSIMADVSILEEEAEVIMTWSQLKMLAQTLSSTIDALEQEIGEVKIPKNFKIDMERQRAVVRSLGLNPG
jgi:hypothetical protein